VRGLLARRGGHLAALCVTAREVGEKRVGIRLLAGNSGRTPLRALLYPRAAVVPEHRRDAYATPFCPLCI